MTKGELAFFGKKCERILPSPFLFSNANVILSGLALYLAPYCQVYFDKCPEEPHLEFKGERYDLLQIHIHSPSEHIVSKVGVTSLGALLSRCLRSIQEGCIAHARLSTQENIAGSAVGS